MATSSLADLAMAEVARVTRRLADLVRKFGPGPRCRSDVPVWEHEEIGPEAPEIGEMGWYELRYGEILVLPHDQAH